MKKMILTLFLLLFVSLVQAESYNEITPAQPTQTGSNIEVVEVFWYGCPHCFDFEPHLKKWLQSKPSDVEFRRMPAIFRRDWIVHARAFYTTIALGVVDKIHQPLFNALHKEKRKLHNEKALKLFFEEHGVSGDKFSRIYASEETTNQIKKALLMERNYKITGVPAMVVNGKYITSSSLSGSHENTLKTVDMLIDKERKRMQVLDAAQAE